MRPTKAIVDLLRFKNNIKQLRSLLNPNTDLMVVVKANAYGHGALKMAEQASKAGATWLGVALPEEGAQLRENGIELPILVLGDITPEQCKTTLQYNLTQADPSIETARFLNDTAKQYGKEAKIHLKFDTGMGRIGFRTRDELYFLVDELSSMRGIQLDGVFTHFATADEADPAYTREQMKKMDSMLLVLEESGIKVNWIHASNSAGVFQFREANYNLVRCGISAYGYYPSLFVKDQAKIKLSPVLQWESRIAYTKVIRSGDTVSYGRAYTANDNIKVATLPVGYADGYPRILSNKSSVLVCGKRALVIGRVCMDQLMIDITDIPDACVGSAVVLLGEQGSEQITADELANLSGTISYEILTSISNRVPRIYQEDSII